MTSSGKTRTVSVTSGLLCLFCFVSYYNAWVFLGEVCTGRTSAILEEGGAGPKQTRTAQAGPPHTNATILKYTSVIDSQKSRDHFPAKPELSLPASSRLLPFALRMERTSASPQYRAAEFPGVL